MSALPMRVRTPIADTDDAVLRVARRFGVASATEIREALPTTVSAKTLGLSLRRLAKNGDVVVVRRGVYRARGAP